MRRALGFARMAIVATSAVFVAATAGAADMDCAGQVVASGVLGAPASATGTMRPVIAFVATEGRGPRGVGLDGVVLPAGAGDAARKVLGDALGARAGETVTVRGEKLALDRRGRARGQVFDAGGAWLQGVLLEAGLVVADAAGGPCDGEMLAAEAVARAAGRGVWAERDFVQPARGFDRAVLPGFVVLEGRVESIGKAGETTYVNFGGRYSEDATVRIAGPVGEKLAAAGIDGGDLGGRRVRVRGFATGRDGLDLPLRSASALQPADDAESR